MADPYWERFCTPLAERILALIRAPAGGGDAADAGSFILEEPIAAVLADGRYQVGADALRTKGKAALRVGQRVHVLWKAGARVVILTHQWQRAQGGTWRLGGGGVVEVLFIADGQVWFRNDQQVTNLGLAAGWDAPPAVVRWGIDGRSFVVLSRRTTCYVYALDGRGADEPYADTAPSATLLATHTPLDDGIVLYAQSQTSTVTGETRYFGQSAWAYPGGDPTTPTTFLGEVDVQPLSRTVSRTGNIVLTRLAVEGQTAPFLQPSIVLTDLQLDADRHVILGCAVQVRSQTAPTISDTASRPIWFWQPIPGSSVAGTATNDPPLLSVGQWHNHLVLVDVTTRTVLWRTCKPTIRHEVTGEEHRFHTILGVKNGSQTSEREWGTSWTAATGVVSQGWSFDVVGSPVATYTDVVSGPAGTGGANYAGVTGYVFDELAADLPYVDATGLFTVQTATTQENNGLFWVGDAGAQSQPRHWVRVIRARRQYIHAKRFGFTGVYRPRPKTAEGPTPRGQVIVTVTEERNTATTPVWSGVQQGCFVHDLETGTVTPLLPMTPGVTFTQGVHLPTPPRTWTFFHLPPATDGAVTILGADGDHVLWLHRHPNYVQADVKLTELSSGLTQVVQTGSADVAGGGLGSSSGLSPELRAVLAMDLQVLVPGVTYYPSDDPAVAEETRNHFIEAWDAAGVPTLDATAPGFPPVDPDLQALGPLKDLAGVVPVPDTTIKVNGGPVNLLQNDTGPSYRVVATEAVKAAAG